MQNSSWVGIEASRSAIHVRSIMDTVNITDLMQCVQSARGTKIKIGKDLCKEYLTMLNDWKPAGHKEVYLGMLKASQNRTAIIFEKSCMTGEVPPGLRKANITLRFKSHHLYLIKLISVPGKLLYHIQKEFFCKD